MYPDCKISNNLKHGEKVRYYTRVKIVPVCYVTTGGAGCSGALGAASGYPVKSSEHPCVFA